jgi:hypothetical protein
MTKGIGVGQIEFDLTWDDKDFREAIDALVTARLAHHKLITVDPVDHVEETAAGLIGLRVIVEVEDA